MRQGQTLSHFEQKKKNKILNKYFKSVYIFTLTKSKKKIINKSKQNKNTIYKDKKKTFQKKKMSTKTGDSTIHKLFKEVASNHNEHAKVDTKFELSSNGFNELRDLKHDFTGKIISELQQFMRKNTNLKTVTDSTVRDAFKLLSFPTHVMEDYKVRADKVVKHFANTEKGDKADPVRATERAELVFTPSSYRHLIKDQTKLRCSEKAAVYFAALTEEVIADLMHDSIVEALEKKKVRVQAPHILHAIHTTPGMKEFFGANIQLRESGKYTDPKAEEEMKEKRDALKKRKSSSKSRGRSTSSDHDSDSKKKNKKKAKKTSTKTDSKKKSKMGSRSSSSSSSKDEEVERSKSSSKKKPNSSLKKHKKAVVAAPKTTSPKSSSRTHSRSHSQTR